jgi:hypothetical protein
MLLNLRSFGPDVLANAFDGVAASVSVAATMFSDLNRDHLAHEHLNGKG